MLEYAATNFSFFQRIKWTSSQEEEPFPDLSTQKKTMAAVSSGKTRNGISYHNGERQAVRYWNLNLLPSSTMPKKNRQEENNNQDIDTILSARHLTYLGPP